MVEIPLNSPRPLDSITRLADALSDRGIIGAGTVLDRAEVADVARAGARFVVSPNFDPAVVETARSLNLATYPGVFTPTECLAALRAGAGALKIFPAEIMGPAGIKALRAVLPGRSRLIAVGGADPGSFLEWRQAGVDGFGLGSYLFVPGRSVKVVHERARKCVSAYDALPDRAQQDSRNP